MGKTKLLEKDNICLLRYCQGQCGSKVVCDQPTVQMCMWQCCECVCVQLSLWLISPGTPFLSVLPQIFRSSWNIQFAWTLLRLSLCRPLGNLCGFAPIRVSPLTLQAIMPRLIFTSLSVWTHQYIIGWLFLLSTLAMNLLLVQLQRKVWGSRSTFHVSAEATMRLQYSELAKSSGYLVWYPHFQHAYRHVSFRL